MAVIERGITPVESEMLSPVVARVALLSIAVNEHAFWLHQLPLTHKYAPGKIDLLTVEDLEDHGFRKRLYRHLGEHNLFLKINTGYLGTDQDVRFNQKEGVYRDTRRMFFSSSSPFSEADKLIEMGLRPFTFNEIRELDPTVFRRPSIITALHAHHNQLLRSKNTKAIDEQVPFQTLVHDKNNIAVSTYLLTHTWKYPIHW